MAKTVMIRIVPTKLRREFEKRGLSMKEVAIELGYGGDYFNNCCNRLRISKMAALSLQTKYDIRVEEYEATEEEPAPVPVPIPCETPSAPSFELDYDRLYNLVYEAVYQAVKKAWAE